MEKAVRTRRRKAAEPSPYHHGDLRNELVRQGRLFLETAGAGEISMAELARRCGVSDAAPFKHFESKEELLAVIATEGIAELVAQLTAIAESPLGSREKVRDMLMNYVRFGTRNPGLFNLMFGARIVDPNRYPQLQAIGTKSFEIFSDAIGAFAVEHGWAPHDIDLLTHGAWAMEHGITTLILARRAPHRSGKVGTEEMIDFAVAMTVGSIAAGPPGKVAASAKRKTPARRAAA